MAAIDFYADTFNLNGSGLGFYGSSFGQSVDVGSYQNTTYITNSNGTAQGELVNNIRYQGSAPYASGYVASELDPTNLTHIPNYLATLNVRFTHSSAVKAQNVKCRIYDRSSINNPASGVTTKLAELIHPDTVTGAGGSGDTAWLTPAGSSVIVDLAPSPGISGLYAGNGSNSVRSDTRHDWYMAISASPDSIGSKTLYGLYISLEYL